MSWLHRFGPALALALVAYGLLVSLTMGSPGMVGEVEASQVLADPPAVLVITQPPTWADPSREPHAGHALGTWALALEASQVRPLESVRVAGLRLPVAVNTYTGGLPDWPARLAHAATGSRAVVQALHAVLGALVLVGVWWLARRVRAPVAAGAAVLYLAVDWNFLFYRQVLGGTEVALLLAGLLVVAGLWDRRWGGGGLWWTLPLGVGLGLHAKLTFAAPLAGLAVAALLTRWDRGSMGEPRPWSRRQWWVAGAVIAALLAPLLVVWVHHAVAVPDAPHLRSHDFVGLQVRRLVEGLGALVSGGHAPDRESPANVVSFLVQPLDFFTRACGAGPVPLAAGRMFGWLLLVAGTALSWWDREATPAAALTRYLSLAVPIAGAALFLANRDMHHLATLSALVALWAGLATVRVAALVSPPRSLRRAAVAAALLVPWLVSGALTAWRTDTQLAACSSPLVRSDSQALLVERLRQERPGRLVYCDYDLYGLLNLHLPGADRVNGWGAMSHSEDRRSTMADLISLARGGHLLLVRPSAPTIYGFNPSEGDLRRLSGDAGATLDEVWRLEDADGTWARLYRVDAP